MPIMGKALIQTPSESLQSEFGKGFSQRNLEQMRTFNLEYPIPQTLSAEFQADSPDSIRETPVFRLSWSHYLNLISIKNIEERRFYEIESIENNWSIRELKRQYDSDLYMRLALPLRFNENRVVISESLVGFSKVMDKFSERIIRPSEPAFYLDTPDILTLSGSAGFGQTVNIRMSAKK